MGTKIDVKDKIDGDTMDLSFLELTEVPLRDMASFKKVRTIDLSTNKLVRLPTNFVTLTHLVKLDLSKNQLKELPENFGQLKKLRHLDLFNNQLKQLPLSFCELRDLKFLDLKDNPLVPVLKDAAGDCVDTKACQQAAKKVVELMGTLKVEVEKQVQKEKEKKEREEKERREAEAAMLEDLRRQKRAEKERRRNEARKLESQQNGREAKTQDSGYQEPPQYYERPVPARENPDRGNTFLGFVSGMLLTVALTVLVCFLGILLARWSGPITADNVARNVRDSYGASTELLQNSFRETTTVVKDLGGKLQKLANIQYLDRVVEKVQFLWGVVSVKLYELLSHSYQAGIKGVELFWKQGGDIMRWFMDEFPKWRSEIAKKFM